MNTRVILIDDDAPWAKENTEKLNRELADQCFPAPEVVWINPHDFREDTSLIQHVREMAHTARWDAILIDINLGRPDEGKISALLLPFLILEAFRESNQAAIGLIYSGTILERLRQLLNQVLDKKHPEFKTVEETVRNVLTHQARGFCSRDQVLVEAIGELQNPPWSLRLERAALQAGSVLIDWAALGQNLSASHPPAENFFELSCYLRKESRFSAEFARLVMDHGIAAMTDIYALSVKRSEPLLCVTAQCFDLKYLFPIINETVEWMPQTEVIILQSNQPTIQQITPFRDPRIKTVVIMLHGGDGYLKGADPNPAADILTGFDWMNSSDQHALLAGKVVYCFSCKSNSLATNLVKAGAIAFIGFPDIPFYRFENGKPIDEPALTITLQALYGRLTRTVLFRWFEGTQTVEEVVVFIRTTVRAMTQEFIRENPNHPYQNEVVQMFDRIALGVDYKGDGNWKFPG